MAVTQSSSLGGLLNPTCPAILHSLECLRLCANGLLGRYPPKLLVLGLELVDLLLVLVLLGLQLAILLV